MSVAQPFARVMCVLLLGFAFLGCSGGETTPPEEIPDIPPATRTMPGEDGSGGAGAIPSQPPR